MADEALVNKYHQFLVNLAFDDGNDPTEAATDFLQGISLPRRIECMRYWLAEYENGQLDTLHKFRNDSGFVHALPDVPYEEMDILGIIDNTLNKLRAMIEEVPNWLIKAEEQYHGLSPESSSHLQQAKDILRASEERSPSVAATIEPVSTPAKKPNLLNHKDAATFLGWAESRLYRFKGLARRYEGKGNLWYLQSDLIALLESMEKTEKPTSKDGDTLPDAPSNTAPTRTGRGRKRQKDEGEI